MKTNPKALRDLADYIAKSDDPDRATALRWAADDIEELNKEIKLLEDKLSDLRMGVKSLGGLL